MAAIKVQLYGQVISNGVGDYEGCGEMWVQPNHVRVCRGWSELCADRDTSCLLAGYVRHCLAL